MSSTSRRTGPGGGNAELVLVWTFVALAVLVLGSVWVAVHVGAVLDDAHGLPANPFDLAFGLLGGDLAWPASATWVLAALLAVVLLLGAVTTAAVLRRRGRAERVDRAAAHMGRGREVRMLSEAHARATAQRLGVRTDAVGLPVAVTVAGRQRLWSTWEDCAVDIWGPRTGKTTSRAVPAILEAPGCCVVTSNKRDVVDATRDPRAAMPGGQVWVFDPQGIVAEEPTWWWNPLSYVVDEVKADQLAELFAVYSRDADARTDAFFDPAAQDLLSGLLLAAALDRQPITQVYLWLTKPTDDEPAAILTEHDYPLIAKAVQAHIDAPDKQRGGVYGTALKMASFLTNRAAVRWVTPPTNPYGARREFSPEQFVTTASTLYSLSKEGKGSAGPLVTALTVAVTEAAEEQAKGSPGGRLPVPMVAVLDEAANVCRWRELPNLYSHYGSRGICLSTILQSWSQGVQVWGRDGMRKLWSAANIKVYGGGVSEVEFLRELSELIGDHDAVTASVSHGGRGGRSTSRQLRTQRVLDVADLGAMPKGRAIVFASGARPTLVKTQPWMDGPHAEQVRASILAHDPGAQDTLDEAYQQLDQVRATEAVSS